MVCTDDRGLYEVLRMLRSHGMVRESSDAETKEAYHRQYPDLTPDFIFAFPAYNVRSTEINAVIGRSQLKRLDANNARRQRNLELFLNHLDPAKYRTDFETAGKLQLRLHAVLTGARRPAPRPRDGYASGVRRRVPPRHFRRRQSASAAVLEKASGGRQATANARTRITFISTAFTWGTIPAWKRRRSCRVCEILNELEG